MKLSQNIKNNIISIVPSLFRRRAFRRIENVTQDMLERKRMEPELLLIGKLLQRDKVFFDVGANVGDYIYMAKKYVMSHLIYGFEPQPILSKRLHALFPDINIETIALSDTSGTATLKVPFIHGHIYTSRATLTSIREEGEDGSEALHVPTATVDSYHTKLDGVPIGCMKIDVEGNERNVIAGARDTLMNDHPNLIVEIEQRHHKDDIEEIFRDIMSLGYTGFFIDFLNRQIAPLSRFSVGTHQDMHSFKTGSYINNFIFLPKDKQIQLEFDEIFKNI